MKLSYIDISALETTVFKKWLLGADEEKQKSINKIPTDGKKQLRIAADRLCRVSLSPVLGMKPEEIVFGKNDFGKPTAQGAEFNISHSGSLAVCVVSKNPVGIDIEKVRDIRPETAKKFATDEEIAYIGESSERLIKIWTLKEAYFKCLGTGLGSDIKSVSFAVKGDEIACSESGFSCRFVFVADGYICAVCEKSSFISDITFEKVIL